MIYKFGQVLTAEEVAAVPTPSKAWVEPIEVIVIPTAEEMATWMPDPAPENRRFRWEQNVITGERKAIELTLDEYRQRHINKLIGRNEWLQNKLKDERKAKRDALLEKLLDELEAKVI